MWVLLNNAFLSIVAHRDDPELLLVRARKEGDIEQAIPDADVWIDAEADYRYRAEVPRPFVARALADVVASIDYDNFKNSVSDPARHSAYAAVWRDLAALQAEGGRYHPPSSRLGQQ
jgi:hypothetical protein